jgi:hypothetical protein
MLKHHFIQFTFQFHIVENVQQLHQHCCFNGCMYHLVWCIVNWCWTMCWFSIWRIRQRSDWISAIQQEITLLSIKHLWINWLCTTLLHTDIARTVFDHVQVLDTKHKSIDRQLTDRLALFDCSCRWWQARVASMMLADRVTLTWYQRSMPYVVDDLRHQMHMLWNGYPSLIVSQKFMFNMLSSFRQVSLNPKLR